MKRTKLCALALVTGMILTSLTACANSTSGTDGTSSDSSSSSETSATIETIKISEDITDTVVTYREIEVYTYSGDEQTYVNTFITNFAEQYFYVVPDKGKFDVANASVEDVLMFAFYHVKINSYRDFEPAQKGECSYATLSFSKVSEVVGKYMSYMLKEDDCKKLPAPPDSIDNFGFGPFYEDGKIWFVAGDGDTYRDIGIVDYAESDGDGTLTLYFTIYNIDFDVYDSLDDAGVKKYYTLSPSQAANDSTLTMRGTGVANVDVGQSGKYYLRTYEVTLG